MPGARVHLWLFLLTTHTRSVFVQRYVGASFHLVQYATWRRASTISFLYILLCKEELPQSVFVYRYVAESFHHQFLYIAMWMGVFTISFVYCYVEGSFQHLFRTTLCGREFPQSILYNAVWQEGSFYSQFSNITFWKEANVTKNITFWKEANVTKKIKTNKQTKAKSPPPPPPPLCVCACVWCGVVWFGVCACGVGVGVVWCVCVCVCVCVCKR